MFLHENIDDFVVCNNTLIALLMTTKNLPYNARMFETDFRLYVCLTALLGSWRPM